MKKTLPLLTAILFYFSAHADHTAGVDFTYTWISGNTYEFHLDFYRGCNGANGTGGCILGFNSNCTQVNSASCVGAAGAVVYFSYAAPSCGFCYTDSFPAASLVKTDVTPICPSMQTNCSGGALAGIEKWSYTKTVTLPYQCNDWTFIYGVYARSASLTTVNNPGGTGFCVRATLDNLNVPGNSSPSFASPNISYLCTGQPFCYNQATIEPDGDSLVYILTNPRSGVFNGNFINYNGGYAFNNPFGAGSPITFDPATGSMCVTPATQLVTVTDVRVSEFRNGMLIGSVERDMEFIVTACTNAMPEVSGINGAPYLTNNTDSVCEGSQLCFNVNGSDLNAGDTLTVSYNNPISGASFTISNNGSFNPGGQFCWTPVAGDASSIPYVFTVTIHDNACPYEGVQSFPFFIYVNSCGTILPSAAFTGDSTICPGTCTDFTNLSLNATSYSWNFPGGNPSSSTDANPSSICYANPGLYEVQLIATSAGGSDTLTVINYVNVFPTPPPQGIQQIGDTLFANPGATSYQWYYNLNAIPGATDYYYLAIASGDYNVVATDENGCEVEAVINNVLANAQLAVGNLQMAIEVFPNPVSETIDILGLGSNPADEISIFNVVGEKIFSAVDCKLPIANCLLSPGMYSIEIISGENIYRSTFLKQ